MDATVYNHTEMYKLYTTHKIPIHLKYDSRSLYLANRQLNKTQNFILEIQTTTHREITQHSNNI
eukprot:GAHX01002905.1.p1 GENE.GAHX01002905.1~~GAHX01002905.1.p1  ORF type:complete len:64 (+),score=12.37 GAHX01002905.1:33-224(+)